MRDSANVLREKLKKVHVAFSIEAVPSSNPGIEAGMDRAAEVASFGESI